MDNKEKVVRILRKRGFPISLDDLVSQSRVSERGVIDVCQSFYENGVLKQFDGQNHRIYLLSKEGRNLYK